MIHCMGKGCSRQRKDQQNVTQEEVYLADLSVTFNMDREKSEGEGNRKREGTVSMCGHLANSSQRFTR